MLSVFGDESSDETGQRTFAVAGVMGTQEEWDKLEIKWIERTKGRFFHGADLETDQGDFKGIPHEENQKLYADLTNLLARSNMMGFGSAMDIHAYKKCGPSGFSVGRG